MTTKKNSIDRVLIKTNGKNPRVGTKKPTDEITQLINPTTRSSLKKVYFLSCYDFFRFISSSSPFVTPPYSNDRPSCNGFNYSREFFEDTGSYNSPPPSCFYFSFQFFVHSLVPCASSTNGPSLLPAYFFFLHVKGAPSER